MKKFYYSLFAAASMMLAVTSCSQEEDFPQSSSEMTTFSVSLDGATGSRAVGDGKKVDKLYYAVYATGTENVIYPKNAKYGVAIDEDIKKEGWNFELPLMKSETYDILFWAQSSQSDAYTFTDLKNIKVNYGKSNVEERDAFSNALAKFKVSGGDNIVVLRRPYAQLNIATSTTDWDNAVAIYGENPVTSSSVTISSELATKFNVLTGEASEPQANVVFSANALNKDKNGVEIINIAEKKYRLLAMNYLLPVGTKIPNGVNQYSPAEGKANAEVEFTLYKGEGKKIVTVKVPSTPIQRNWRTNIIGDLLTGEGFDVIIDKEFDGDENQEIEISAQGIVKDADGIYHITETVGLWNLAKLVNYGSTASTGRAVADYYTFKGETFVLDCNIDLQGEDWTPMDNFAGTFDGNGKKISNFKVNKDVSAGLFGNLGTGATIKNLTVTGATIHSTHWAGVIAGRGLCVNFIGCTVENSSVTVDPTVIDAKNDYNGDKAGSIIGYISGEPNALIEKCSAKDVTIQAYRDLGGIVGYADGYAKGPAVIKDNKVENIVLVIDNTNNYKEYDNQEKHDAGAIVGEAGTNTKVDNNTSVEGTITTIYTASKEYPGYYKDANGKYIVTENKGITNLIKKGETTITLNNGTYIIPDEAKGQTLTFIGTGSPEDVTINPQDDGATEGDCDYSLEGATATFENVTITTTATYFPGYVRMKGTYNNCIINGVYTLYDNSTFTNCTFNISGDLYNVWTWGATEATFNKCTFNSDGKAVLLYGQVDTKLTINECVFNDKGGLSDKKAAIEIGNDYSKSYVLTVNKTTVNGYEINDKGIPTGTTLFGNKNSMSIGETLKVVVDGLTFVSAGIWKDAENYIVSNSDALNTCLNDPNIKNIILGEGEFGTIVAKSKKTITGTEKAKVDCVNLNGAGNLTLKNIKFDAAKAQQGYDQPNKGGTARAYANIIVGDKNNNPSIGARNLVIDNCTFEGTFESSTESFYAAIAFNDRSRPTGGSANVTIKNCTFDTQSGNYDIYGYYTGNSAGNFVIEKNEFKSTTKNKPVYFGRIQSSNAIVVKDNNFTTVASLEDAVTVQPEGSYNATIDDSGNTFN